MIAVREAGPADLDLLLPLLLDMERHYEGDGAQPEDVLRARLADGLAPGAPGVVLVAEEAGAALGFATLFPVFPARDGRPGAFLKELYAAEAARGRGVGELLMRRAARIARDLGAQRLDLMTGADNAGAQRFYERLGGVRPPSVVFRWADDDLARLAAQDGG